MSTFGLCDTHTCLPPIHWSDPTPTLRCTTFSGPVRNVSNARGEEDSSPVAGSERNSLPLNFTLDRTRCLTRPARVFQSALPLYRFPPSFNCFPPSFNRFPIKATVLGYTPEVPSQYIRDQMKHLAPPGASQRPVYSPVVQTAVHPWDRGKNVAVSAASNMCLLRLILTDLVSLDTYTMKPPSNLPPTYRGRTLRFSYQLSVGACRATAGVGAPSSQSRVMKVPIRIYNHVSGRLLFDFIRLN